MQMAWHLSANSIKLRACIVLRAYKNANIRAFLINADWNGLQKSKLVFLHCNDHCQETRLIYILYQ